MSFLSGLFRCDPSVVYMSCFCGRLGVVLFSFFCSWVGVDTKEAPSCVYLHGGASLCVVFICCGIGRWFCLVGRSGV